MPRKKRTYLRPNKFQPHPADVGGVEELSNVRSCTFGLTPRNRVYGVSGCLADSNVDALLQLPELIEVSVLDLSDSLAFTDSGLEQLFTHSSLKIFGCNGNSAITDRSAAALCLSRQMRWFCLNGCAITDVGVQHISECRQLLGLYLDCTAITEECVPYLCRLTNLRYLRLTNTLVTESFRDRLSAHLPRCRSLRLGRRQNAE